MTFIESIINISVGIIMGVILGLKLAKFLIKRNKKKLEEGALDKILNPSGKPLQIGNKTLEDPEFIYDEKKVNLKKAVKNSLKEQKIIKEIEDKRDKKLDDEKKKEKAEKKLKKKNKRK